MTSLIIFATAAVHQSEGIFDALGVNLQVLVIQIIAFIILLLILRKFVYPWLIKSVDEYHENIDNASNAAESAKASAKEAQEKVTKIIIEAKAEARDILLMAKKEASLMISDSEEKAKEQSAKIIASAQDNINKEVIAAKKALRDETLELVALATEKVIGKVMTSESDSKLIDEAIKEVK